MPAATPLTKGTQIVGEARHAMPGKLTRLDAGVWLRAPEKNRVSVIMAATQ